MCGGCWEEGGKPEIRSAAVRRAAEAITALYSHETDLGCCGGALHIVTDDWNVEDGSVEFCRSYIGQNERDPQYQAEYCDEILASFTAVEQAAFDALKPLTAAERTSALGLEAGFWEWPRVCDCGRSRFSFETSHCGMCILAAKRRWSALHERRAGVTDQIRDLLREYFAVMKDIHA